MVNCCIALIEQWLSAGKHGPQVMELHAFLERSICTSVKFCVLNSASGHYVTGSYSD